MKFNFKIQQYQTDAVDAVVRVFQGQGFHDKISYIRDQGKVKAESYQMTLGMSDEELEVIDPLNDTGYKNEAVELSDEQLLHNIQTLQSQNNIKLSASLVKDLGRCSLDIEMETGTGKTYVYIKTMFELNTKYGWSKFIVVVPSIAIREGVKKSFEITADHFMEHYGKKARFFIYNSSNLNQLDNFSSSSGINVMIINTQAFAASLNEEKNVEGRRGDAAARIIYSRRDEFGSRRPIDVIKANRPIIILDEPQKMGGDVTQKALKNFNQLPTPSITTSSMCWMRWTPSTSGWSRKSRSRALRSRTSVARTATSTLSRSFFPARSRRWQKLSWRSATTSPSTGKPVFSALVMTFTSFRRKWSSTRATPSPKLTRFVAP
jgi:type III restriction enzyme